MIFFCHKKWLQLSFIFLWNSFYGSSVCHTKMGIIGLPGLSFFFAVKKKQNLIINFLMVNEPKCSTKQFIKFLICKVEIVKKSPVASNMEINKKKKKMHIQVVSTFYPNQTNSHCDLKFWFGRFYVCCTYHVHLNNLIETKTKTNSFHRIHTCGIERNNFKSAPCIYVYLRTKREVKKTANERR